MLKMKRIFLFLTIMCFALSGFSQKKWGSIDTSTSSENLMNGLWRYQSSPNGFADKDSLRIVPYKLLKSYVAANSGGATSFYDSTLMASTKRLKDSAAAIRAAFPAAVGPGGGSGNIQVNTVGGFAGYNDFIWDPGGRNLLITSPNLDAAIVTGYNTGRSTFTVNSQFGSAVGGFFAYNDRASYGAFTLYGIYGSSATGTIIGKSLADASVLYTAGANNSGLIIGTQTSAPITIGTNDIERLSIDGSGHPKWTLGSDATGDIWYRNSSGYFTRLAIGTAGQHLVGGTTPHWVDTASASSGTGPSTAYSNTATGKTANHTMTFTTDNDGVSHLYRVNPYTIITTGSGAGDSKVKFTLSFTDGGGNTVTTQAMSLPFQTTADGLAATAVGSSNYQPVVISISPNTTITFSWNVSGTNGMTWSESIVLEKIL
jgi:hypothetical protein